MQDLKKNMNPNEDSYSGNNPIVLDNSESVHSIDKKSKRENGSDCSAWNDLETLFVNKISSPNCKCTQFGTKLIAVHQT